MSLSQFHLHAGAAWGIRAHVLGLVSDAAAPLVFSPERDAHSRLHLVQFTALYLSPQPHVGAPCLHVACHRRMAEGAHAANWRANQCTPNLAIR